MDVINILAPLNIFAGGLTIATQFVTPCSEPNLENLLALASELFLASIAGLVIVFLLLYGFWDTDIIQDGPKPARCCGWNLGRHSLVVAQIVIVGFMMIAAFFALGVAIIIIGNHWARGFGMALVFFMFVGAILIGIMIGRNKYVRVPGSLAGPPDPVPIHDVERDLTKGQGIALAWFFLLEFVIMVILVGLGIWQAIDPPQTTCDASSIFLQGPLSTLAVSEANPQTNPQVTFTDVDNVLSITLTNVNPIISLSTITSTTSLTTTITTETTFPTTISVAIISTISIGPDFSQDPDLSPYASSLLSSEPTPCFSSTSFKTPQSFITSIITSTIPCTTENLVNGWARRARHNLLL